MSQISKTLLSWYDEHARTFPWRMPPNSAPQDPYRAWLAEVMLQQTTTTAVIPYYEKFLKVWPSIEDLADAEDKDVMEAWAGLGYYARARNMLAAARAVSDLGRFPDTSAELAALPGFGPYTSAAVAAISFGERVAVVDGNVKRVFYRLRGDRDAVKDSVMRQSVYDATPQDRPGDFAQAVMDIGSTICKPRNPKCDLCPLSPLCAAFAAGDPENFPQKTIKAAKPKRTGTIWVLYDGDAVLTLTRPASGLLGGTLALPSAGWDKSPEPALPAVEWTHVGNLKHVFTHFEAEVDVMCAEGSTEGGEWRVPSASAEEFPTLMRKAILISRHFKNQ